MLVECSLKIKYGRKGNAGGGVLADGRSWQQEAAVNKTLVNLRFLNTIT